MTGIHPSLGDYWAEKKLFGRPTESITRLQINEVADGFRHKSDHGRPS